jgi:lysophospholipase L1-like esterase
VWYRSHLGKGVLVLILSCLASFLLLELLVRIFLPIRSFTVGTSDASTIPNAALYGWGYAPGAEIKQTDPDTGEVFSSRANSGGWKDVEHQLKKARGSVRILILGDSNTFGRVPLEHIYPRVLEELLGNAGFNAEVISMGYGNWGTDQELMALKYAGLAYNPDIVINQFDTNDLGNNLALDDMALLKPFRFQIVNGELNMRAVQPKPAKPDERPGTWVKRVLLRSHVIFYLNKVKWILLQRVGQFRGEDRPHAPGINPTGPYFVFHLSQRGDPGIEAAWLLYEKLVEEMKRCSEKNGAIFVLFNQIEKGRLACEKRWHWIVEDNAGHHATLWQGRLHPIYYYRHIDRLNDIARRIGALIVPNRRSYTRFDNDCHPNIEGNRRMAKDIFDFLITEEKTSHVLLNSRVHFD